MWVVNQAYQRLYSESRIVRNCGAILIDTRRGLPGKWDSRNRDFMPVIAIDLGTTGCKAAVFDGSRMLASAYRHYTYAAPEDGWAEQDAEAVWLLVDGTVREALSVLADKTALAAADGDEVALLPPVSGG